MSFTKQARFLRGARDELEERVSTLAGAKDRRGLVSLGLSPVRALELINGECFNSQDLADLLGASLHTLRAWITPKRSKVHREMPKMARLLLHRILADLVDCHKGRKWTS